MKMIRVKKADIEVDPVDQLKRNISSLVNGLEMARGYADGLRANAVRAGNQQLTSKFEKIDQILLTLTKSVGKVNVSEFSSEK